MDAWRTFVDGFEKWLKYTCYLGFVWVFLDILPYLPPKLADRIIEAALGRFGI